MLGNDVVDLHDPESDPATLHPRFDERVFAEDERRALLSSKDLSAGGGAVRWRIWAAKEAAYKAVRQVYPRAVFSPARFRTEWSTRARGFVTCDEARCEVRVEERDGTVHAVARLAGVPVRTRGGALVAGVYRAGSRDGVGTDPEAPSRIARAFAESRIAAALGLDAGELEIRKRGRVPELWCSGLPTGCELSLSHHGAVVAFVCDPTAFSRPRASGRTRASA